MYGNNDVGCKIIRLIFKSLFGLIFMSVYLVNLVFVHLISLKINFLMIIDGT
jgi:hypothetical protein